MRKKIDDADMRAVFKSEEEMANYQRACMIEKWMGKKFTENTTFLGKSTADLEVKMSRKDRQDSSSSGSSFGGGGFFSYSYESEYFPTERPKPIRTAGEGNSEINGRGRRCSSDQSEKKPKHDSRFFKTKYRELKIYGDLKKAKQPISPGGKVAAFLHSLFTTGNLRKAKIATTTCGSDDSQSLKSTNASTCSSVSSFSRSCLSKTSSSSKSFGGGKRSVRFSPVSIIVDDDCDQPRGHKALHQVHNKNNANFIKTASDHEDLLMHIMEKNRRVEEAAGDFLMNYYKKDEIGREFEPPFDHLRKINVENRGFDQECNEEEDEDEDFDAESYASSDLFELDNLSAIGMKRFSEELPVYETTILDKIKTTANGFIV